MSKYKRARRLKKDYFRNIKVIILKTVLYYSQYAQLGSFSNLPGFSWLFLFVDIGDFLQKDPVENLQNK